MPPGGASAAVPSKKEPRFAVGDREDVSGELKLVPEPASPQPERPLPPTSGPEQDQRK